MTLEDTIGVFLTLAVAAFVASLLPGCGGPPKAVRYSLALGAQAVAELDQQAVRRLEAIEAQRCPSAGQACPPGELAKVERVVRAAESAGAALLSAEASADAWEAGAQDGADFGVLAGCVVRALGRAAEAAIAAGWDPPKILGQAVDAMGAVESFVACEVAQ